MQEVTGRLQGGGDGSPASMDRCTGFLSSTVKSRRWARVFLSSTVKAERGCEDEARAGDQDFPLAVRDSAFYSYRRTLSADHASRW